jgi:hypothetical protein
MRATLSIALAIAAAACAAASQAGDYDGSRPLICATMQAMDCAAGEDCLRGLPTDVGAPTFMRIDFAQKAVIGPKRASPVLFMESSGGQLLLQGHELGFGWTIALDQDSGQMSATLVDRDGAYVLFGACTTQ